MGALIGNHITEMSMAAMVHDLENMRNKIMDKRQYLAFKTMNLSAAKASAFEASAMGSGQQQKVAQMQSAQIEQIENMLQQMDKILEMKEKTIETQINAARQRMESAQKANEKNIKQAFSFQA